MECLNSHHLNGITFNLMKVFSFFYKHLKRGSNCRFSILVKCGAMTPYSEEQLQVQLDFVIQNNIRSVIAIGIWILLCPFCDFNYSQIGALASVFLSCM